MRSLKLWQGFVAALITVAGAGAARARTWVSFAPDQMALTAGGGIADFVGSTMRGNTRLGGDWDARLTFGTRSPVAFEAGYTGLYNTLSSGSTVSPSLMQHSVDGVMRLNLLPWRVQPYIFAGVGYNHAAVRNRDQDPAMAAQFRGSDDQLMVPAGGGVAAYFGAGEHITADARFTYRSIFYDDLLIAAPGARQDTYTVAGRLGYAF
jgi:Outer membrane protein beta-barrel domain